MYRAVLEATKAKAMMMMREAPKVRAWLKFSSWTAVLGRGQLWVVMVFLALDVEARMAESRAFKYTGAAWEPVVFAKMPTDRLPLAGGTNTGSWEDMEVLARVNTKAPYIEEEKVELFCSRRLLICWYS
jgi:hypothetical protein